MAAVPQHAEPAEIGTAAIVVEIEARLSLLPIEELERLARRLFSPSALRNRRHADRDNAIRELFRRYVMPGLLAAGGKLTTARRERATQRKLRLYAAAWPRECAKPIPADPERALLYRIYQLSNGEPPKDTRRIFSKV